MKTSKRNILFIVIIILFAFGISGCLKTKDEVNGIVSIKDYELEFKNGTRLFKSEVTPKTEAEKVILNTLKIEISDKYDEFKNMYIDDEQFNYFPRIYKEQFYNGQYAERITIHSLKKLSKEEYISKADNIKNYNYIDRLNKYKPYEFEIIEINYTVKYTDKKNEMAQWGNGNWTRYYVVVKQNEKSNWRIFDIYGHM